MNNSLPLFRDAATPGRRDSDSGRPIATTPVSWRVLTWFLVLMFAAALWFLATQKIARRETARGIVTLSLGELRIVPPHPGIVTAVYVTEGQTVEPNQRLAAVSTSQYLINGGAMEAEVLAAIGEERAALMQQVESLDSAAPTEQRGQRDRLLDERQRLAEMLQLLPRKQERLSLAEQAYQDGKHFHEQGAISGDVLRERQYDWITQQTEVRNLNAQIADLQGSIAHDEATLAELPKQQAKQRAEVLNQLAALQERQLSTTGQEGYLISARVRGRVTALQVRGGQYVDSTRPLMTLTPTESTLQAELYVPSKAIAFAKRGQEVRLMYDAFPYQQFGQSFGRVEDISATVLKPDEIGAAVPLKEPTYRVIVIPDKNTVRAYGVDVPLRSGMALSADLILEKRSFLRLMLDPVIAAQGRILAGAQDDAR